ncbi:hypothetical protein C9212_25695 [Escherichia coli]|nr:hypothetical protein C9212_25695 [Escherichia coli]TJE70624.1 hypothetical protein C9208_25870 [Escherichia coli]
MFFLCVFIIHYRNFSALSNIFHKTTNKKAFATNDTKYTSRIFSQVGKTNVWQGDGPLCEPSPYSRVFLWSVVNH